jgi:membrane protein implicated in regulation of membrane protease activity
MFAIYLAALAAAATLFLVQLVGGGESDHGGGSEGAAGEDGTEAGAGGGDVPLLLSALTSVRAWMFFGVAFGLVGTLLDGFALSAPVVTFALALCMGVGAGGLAHYVVRRVLGVSRSSLVVADELVGKTARVLVAIRGGGRGKVRVDVRASTVDVVARAESPIDAGALVLVVGRAGDDVLVEPAPPELVP